MRKRLTAVIGAVALAVAGFTPSAHAASSSLQCAEFARLFSGIQIFGDAATWWRQAMGKYARGFTPETGSVLVFKASGIMAKGHVAVVSHVLTDRIIQVTHANWSVIDGHRGQVEKDVTVVDVSPTGDWSQVKVWYDPSHNLGSTIYPTYGFVYRAAQQAANVASRIAAATGAKTAATGASSAPTALGEGVPN
jgi:surface antigen